MSRPQSDIVRDLLWAVNSPSLLSPPNAELLAEAARIDEPRIDGLKLSAFIRERPSEKVGRYFERLIHFYLQHVRDVDMVAAGRTLYRDGRTIGELDFVFRLDNQLYHWETAVKFFLCCRIAGRVAYVGPNPDDSLASKSKRLFQHQLPMGAEFDTDVISQALVRGRIFYHPLGADVVHEPVYLARDHLRGYWIRNSELKFLRELIVGVLQPKDSGDGNDVRISQIRKPHWLAPARRDAGDEAGLMSLPLAKSWLQMHFQRSQQPRLVSVMCKRKDGSWREATRMFIVSNHWPGQRP